MEEMLINFIHVGNSWDGEELIMNMANVSTKSNKDVDHEKLITLGQFLFSGFLAGNIELNLALIDDILPKKSGMVRPCCLKFSILDTTE